MDAAEPLARDGEHAEGIGIAQVLLHGEGEFGEIGEGHEIVRMDAVIVETLAIEGRILVGVTDGPFHPLELKRRDFVAGGVFDRVQALGAAEDGGHLAFLPDRCWRRITPADGFP